MFLIINRVFVCDVLNFSFWSEDESHKYEVKYKGKVWTGYWSLCAAINRALDVCILINKINEHKFEGENHIHICCYFRLRLISLDRIIV